MSTPNYVTVAGNLTAEPDLRTTASEIPFCRMRIAVSRRIQSGDTWEDRLDGFYSVICWRDMARHARASLKKGDRVVVAGRLLRRSFEAKSEDGSTETRHVHEIDADEVGGSFRWYPWARVEARALTVEASATPGTTTSEDAEEEPFDEPDVAPAA